MLPAQISARKQGGKYSYHSEEEQLKKATILAVQRVTLALAKR
jgi:hypothetical protein